MPIQFRVKNKRQLDAKNEADRAVLESRARRAGHLVREATPGEVDRFAVGGRGEDCGCKDPQMAQVCRPDSINDCYHEVAGKYGCPLKVTSGGVLNTAGQAIVSIPVEPVQSNFFLPIAMRLVVRDFTNPDTRRFFRLTAVTIKNIPQENYHFPVPTAATVGGVDSSAYFDKISGETTLAVQVAWGPFARQALAENLLLTGFSQYAINVVINAYCEIWGYEIPNLPQGWTCGHHPTGATSPNPNTPSARAA